ncbi:hypothetical protein DRN82_01580 [Thermococci archaeon]|nr:MAG: hypothetical protein DRN82_01580 [Thermococci archaeon]
MVGTKRKNFNFYLPLIFTILLTFLAVKKSSNVLVLVLLAILVSFVMWSIIWLIWRKISNVFVSYMFGLLIFVTFVICYGTLVGKVSLRDITIIIVLGATTLAFELWRYSGS